jgi:diamine N-acetyltransferase
MISLKKITNKNWREIINLDAGIEGRKYVSSNSYTIVEAVFMNKLEYVKAIYYKKKAVGLIWFNPISKNTMFINRFMIDYKYQNKGLGSNIVIK